MCMNVCMSGYMLSYVRKINRVDMSGHVLKYAQAHVCHTHTCIDARTCVNEQALTCKYNLSNICTRISDTSFKNIQYTHIHAFVDAHIHVYIVC